MGDAEDRYACETAPGMTRIGRRALVPVKSTSTFLSEVDVIDTVVHD